MSGCGTPHQALVAIEQVIYHASHHNTVTVLTTVVSDKTLVGNHRAGGPVRSILRAAPPSGVGFRCNANLNLAFWSSDFTVAPLDNPHGMQQVAFNFD